MGDNTHVGAVTLGHLDAEVDALAGVPAPALSLGSCAMLQQLVYGHPVGPDNLERGCCLAKRELAGVRDIHGYHALVGEAVGDHEVGRRGEWIHNDPTLLVEFAERRGKSHNVWRHWVAVAVVISVLPATMQTVLERGNAMLGALLTMEVPLALAATHRGQHDTLGGAMVAGGLARVVHTVDLPKGNKRPGDPMEDPVPHPAMAMADLGTGLHLAPGGAPPIGVGLGRCRGRCAELWRGELLLADRRIRPCSLLCCRGV